ncbi:MAG: phospholipase D family protein [Burkholderiaceae bacterium]
MVDLMHLGRAFLTLILALIAALVLAALLVRPPDTDERPHDVAIPADVDTLLGRLMAAGLAEHPGKSGVTALREASDALASRLALIRAARHSIDAQYYIWHADDSGTLMLGALLDAARRGVRVRLLLDDIGVSGMDDALAALDAQPNFEVRLFNPSMIRWAKLVSYAFDFSRMNRRMHNKALIADGAAAIVGGRNIGDEYFRVADSGFFIDLDVLATGAVVPETAAAFDRYWNSPSAIDVDEVLDRDVALDALRGRVERIRGRPESAGLRADPAISSARYIAGVLPLEWTDVQLVVDDPAKGRGEARRDQLLITRLAGILGRVEQGLDLVSAYFVPAGAGVAYLGGISGADRRVRVLTNAMTTTDVVIVHAGYAKYRRALLAAGVELHELKAGEFTTSGADVQVQPLGFSGASLHTKAFSIDRERIFIGSFNFDPRSALFNCEMGFLIESPAMAARMSDAFDTRMLQVSYRPVLTSEGQVVWNERLPDGSVRTYETEPGTNAWQRAMIGLLGMLPIEWLL